MTKSASPSRLTGRKNFRALLDKPEKISDQPNHGRGRPSFAEATDGSLALTSFRRLTGASQPKLGERRLVEAIGIEPTTSCLQSRRSPN